MSKFTLTETQMVSLKDAFENKCVSKVTIGETSYVKFTYESVKAEETVTNTINLMQGEDAAGSIAFTDGEELAMTVLVGDVDLAEGTEVVIEKENYSVVPISAKVLPAFKVTATGRTSGLNVTYNVLTHLLAVLVLKLDKAGFDVTGVEETTDHANLYKVSDAIEADA